MANKIWRGDAQPTANVWHVTPSGVEIGDSFTILCNRKRITVIAEEATVDDVVNQFVTAFGATDVPEFLEMTATAHLTPDTAGYQTADYLILTGPDDGKPITVTTATSDSDINIIVAEYRKGAAGANEIQEVSINSSASGGTFTLTWDGQTTGNIAYNASAATVLAALEALSNIAPGDVVVSLVSAGRWQVEFAAGYAQYNAPPITGDGASLTGAATLAVVTNTQGSSGVNEKQILFLTSTQRAYFTFTNHLGVAGQTATVYGSYSTAQMQAAIEAMASVGTGNVIVTKNVSNYFVVEFVNLLGSANQALMVGVNSDTGGPINVGESVAGSATGVNEVQAVQITGAAGGTFTLSFSGQTTGNIAYNASAATVQTALEALSTIGAGNATVALTTGTGTRTYTVTFASALAARDVAQMTGSANSLTGGTVTVSLIQSAVVQVNEIQTVTMDGAATGGTFTLTFDGQTTGAIAYNATAATVETALLALSSIDPGEVTVTGVAGGPYTVNFLTGLGGTDVPMITADAGSLTTSASQGLAAVEYTTATGPNWFSDADNWAAGTVPATGDVLIFENSSTSCLYGLDQSAIAPMNFIYRASFTGHVGLPVHNGDYYEYRERYLKLSSGAGAITIDIGEGTGSGSGRININTLDCPTVLNVYKTASSEDTVLPSVNWLGSAATNAVSVLKGSFGSGLTAGESGKINTLKVAYLSSVDSDAEVYLGGGVELGTVTKTGGTLEIGGKSGAAITSLVNQGGDTTINGTDAVTALAVSGGTVYYNTSGTLGGNTALSVDGLLDFSRDQRTKYVTNAIEVYGDVADANDPFKVVSSLVLDYNYTTRMKNIGNNFKLTRAATT